MSFDEQVRIESESAELLQTMIRNACVNDGTEASGNEARNVDSLSAYLDGSGLDVQCYEPRPGRKSLVAQLLPPSPDAPTLIYLAHTDVVAANPDGWKRDPFGGDLVDGEVWGRGAIDMLNLTSTMAVAVRALAEQSRRPDCGLIYAAVADEEAGGTWGASWVAEHVEELRGATALITESGGMPIATPSGPKLPVIVGEKGANWYRLVVRGTPSHGSLSYGADNALVKASRVVERLADTKISPTLLPIWEAFVHGLELDDELTAALTDPSRLDEALARLPEGLAAQCHSGTHMTISPTIVHGGTKVNMVPDSVELQLDLRLLPGDDPEALTDRLRGLIGDLADDVEISPTRTSEGSLSPTGGPVWEALADVTRTLVAGSALVPMLLPGSTDSRYFRPLGIPCYGFGLYSERISFGEFTSMYHGNNERIDTESLGLSAELFRALPGRYAHSVS